MCRIIRIILPEIGNNNRTRDYFQGIGLNYIGLVVAFVHSFMSESPNERNDPSNKGPTQKNIQHQNSIPVTFSSVKSNNGRNKVNGCAY